MLLTKLCFAFWDGGGAGYLANVPQNSKLVQTELGTWISLGFGCVFPDFAHEVAFWDFGMGEAQGA